MLFEGNLKSSAYSKGGEMDSISQLVELQGHITQGVDTGKSGELSLFLQSVYPNI